MGNYFLQTLITGGNGDICPYIGKFRDVFMVAADVERSIFNMTDIAQLVTHNVHVLHSKRDWAMTARRFTNSFREALGARGYDGNNVGFNQQGKLVKINCMKYQADGCAHHNYAFSDDAINYYDKQYNIQVADEQAAATVTAND
jgi:hypothetical protein